MGPSRPDATNQPAPPPAARKRIVLDPGLRIIGPPMTLAERIRSRSVVILVRATAPPRPLAVDLSAVIEREFPGVVIPPTIDVITEYPVDVLEVLKGDAFVVSGTALAPARAGGTVVKDGIEFVKASDQRPLEPGHRYLIVGNHNPSFDRVMFGDVYRVEGAVVEAHDLDRSEPYHAELVGLPVEEALESVRQIVRAHDGPR